VAVKKPRTRFPFGEILLLGTAVVFAIALAEGVLRIIEAERSVSEISYEALRGRSTIDLGALNYNDGRVDRKKESGTYRLLSFGDSYAYSIVDLPYTYHSVAARVASEVTGKEVRLVNLGEPAVSFTQYRNAYDVWARLLEHDGVIFNIYLGNDLLDAAYDWVKDDVGINRLFLNLEWDLRTGSARQVGIPRKYPFRLMDYAYAVYLSATKVIDRSKDVRDGPYNFAMSEVDEQTWLYYAKPQLDNFDPNKLDAMKNGYAALVRFARFLNQLAQSGEYVVVLLSPDQLQVDESVLDRTVGAFGRRKEDLDMDLSAYLVQRIFSEVAPRVAILYLRPLLRCAAHSGLATYRQNETHWSVEGNRIVGEFLGLWLAKNRFAPKTGAPGTVHSCAQNGLRDISSPRLADTPGRTAAYADIVKPLIDSSRQ
jgi:hypothetical protein